MKKIIIMVFLFLALFSTINAGKYNSTYTNFVLDDSGWCKDLEITFTLYNENESLRKQEIEDNLCVDDETPEEDDCEVFTKYSSAKYKIYNGPLDSLQVLTEGTFDANSQFKFTFSESKDFLTIITLDGNYNDLETMITTIPCAGIPVQSPNVEEEINETEETNETQEIIEVESIEELTTIAEQILVDNSFSFDYIDINFKKTSIDSQSKIIFNDNINSQNYPLVENQIKIFEISTSEIYESMGIEIQVDFEQNDIIKVFNYNSIGSFWEEIPFTKEENKIIVETAKEGIYSISKSQEKKEELVLTTETSENNIEGNLAEEDLGSQTNTAEETETEVINKVEEKNSFDIKNVIIPVFVILLILISVIIVMKKHKSIPVNTPITQPIETPEVLDSFSQVYQKTKEYVRKYKPDYEKDQIYRALKEAEIPKDIIDKVFIEEF